MSQEQLLIDVPNNREIQTVEDYKFELIKGYPMLHWKGKRPFTSTQYYPAQLKEVHGDEVNGWRNKIYWGDNLQVMSHLLKEFRGKVNLVYIDPPFDSKAEYKKKINLKGQQVENEQNTFEEKQYTDIWTNDEYLQFMYERLILIRELLAEQGSIYLHCDYHKNHFLRCMLDEIFGINKFQNEIVWHYSGWNKQLKSKFNQRWDSIILYSKTEKPTFNSYSISWESKEHYVKARKQQLHIDDDGREYVLSDAGGGKRVKRYLEEAMASGRHIDDVWDIDKINNSAKESYNYPTQKPEILLERIIKASSNEGDIVFDCFMGSGTTQAVAMKLGRRFIGADINLGAVQITTKRLLEIASELNQQNQQQELEVTEEELTTYYTGFEVYNVNHYDVFRNPVQAKELLIEALEVNPLEKGNLFDGEKDGRMIKIMPVNRIATRADLNELITGFDYKAFEKRQAEHPNKPVEKITLVCMGHEPDLKGQLEKEARPFKIDVEVVDILRDKSNLEFRRDSDAKILIQGQYLVIEKFYPMNLLQKLSLQQENVEDWRELVESIMIDWNYDGAVLEPKEVDVPDKNELVKGRYKIPDDAGTIAVKITDLLSESLIKEVQHG
jgi:site-specific DNA-methyltransferase (adenine-specific)/adenine-specific DNA-methyltransferase